MKDVNRQVVMLVLDKIEKDGTEEFLTYLEAWKLMEVKKVAARIAEVENTIKNRAKLSEQKRVRIYRELESEVSSYGK